MKYLFIYRDKIKKILNFRDIMLFLDYDGTLVPIVNKPEKAIISAETKELLKGLSKNLGCKIAVISGRSLKDIKGKLNLKNIIYVGNHGLELEGPKIKFKTIVSIRYEKILKQIKNDLTKKLSFIKGVILEDKGLSLSLHYRLVDKKHIPQVKTIFHEVVIIYLVRNNIKVKSGKMVLEVRPPIEWDKGKIVLWLLSRQRFVSKRNGILPIYIGDDKTDEDAFKALKNRGITIFVGRPRPSYAQYYLNNTDEVRKFLSRILEIQRNRSLCQN